MGASGDGVLMEKFLTARSHKVAPVANTSLIEIQIGAPPFSG